MHKLIKKGMAIDKSIFLRFIAKFYICAVKRLKEEADSLLRTEVGQRLEAVVLVVHQEEMRTANGAAVDDLVAMQAQ